jgi:hypothetical protein
MYDRRVSRGSTYAPSKRTQPMPHANFRPIPISGPKVPHASPQRYAKEQHPLPPSSAPPADYQPEVDFMRVATPEPVAGRVHCTIQTDTYLEDLRRNKHAQEHDFATQTDPENDRPTQPLFIPRSSGDDVATEIEPDALFDFELEVQSVLNVLVEKSLEQSLMEVCEEEELAELAFHQARFQQDKNLALVGLQQAVQRDERRKAERERRKAQESERLAAEKLADERRRAALVAKRLVARMEEDILRKLHEAGHFYDPVKKEVEQVFMPFLMAATADKLDAYRTATEALDDMVLEGIRAYQTRVDQLGDAADEEEVRALVRYKLDPSNVARPVQSVLSLVSKVGSSEERSARAAAHGSSALAAEAVKVSPEERAQKIVDGILSERAAIKAAEEKRLHDIIIIQSLQRAKRDRARVAKIAEKRRREAERAAMSPQELLVSLRNYLGFDIHARTASAAEEERKESSDVGGFVVCKLDPLGPGAQAGLVLGDRILSVNELAVESVESLAPATLKSPPLSLNPGDTVLLQVQRLTTDGRIEAVALELSTDEDGYDHSAIRSLRADSDLPSSALAWHSADSAAEALAKLGGKLGATVAEQKGAAKLTKISADSAASRAGIKEGEPVTDHKQFTNACKELQAGDIVELELLSPAALEKVQAGATINLRTMTTRKVKIEMGGGGKKLTVEAVRGLRRIAGLPVFGEQ